MVRSSLLAIVAAIAFSMFGGSALANGPTQQGYDETGVVGQISGPGGGSPGTSVLGAHATGGGSSPSGTAGQSAAVTPARPLSAASGGPTLPFTGLDLGIVVMLGGALVGVGMVMRRASRQPDQA